MGTRRGKGRGPKRALVTLARNDPASTGSPDDMAVIHPLERDHGLQLDHARWGARLLDEERGWSEHNGGPAGRHLRRRLSVRESETGERSRDLLDHIIRFPSAPIYGINRKPDYGIEVPRVAFHSLRVLMRPDAENRPVDRLFVFHNGLNEVEHLRFYYQLADWILEKEAGESESRSACLLAPFAGHLTHASFSGPFSQTPLSRYLNDSGELFRQFLRYMAEMRWLLSAVNRETPLDWLVGESPIEHGELAAQMSDECRNLRGASKAALDDAAQGKGEDESLLGSEIERSTFSSTIEALNEVLCRREGRGNANVHTHVVGYSLGGFLAQSVFFTWPNLVSSCATICSGGAIRALSPTAFAHPEEWQAVLHTLRPELEESMLSGRIARVETGRGGVREIAGMREDRFIYCQRIFDQVFLQEDHASYKARLSEYGTRMLFIGGGEDPIVRPREVLDASPKEGITMLSVANLTHFLGTEAQTKRETEQREFWLPEAGGLIARAARQAEWLHAQDREVAEKRHLEARQLEEKSKRAAKRGEEAQERERTARAKGKAPPRRPKERDLESPDFESALDWVIDGVRRRYDEEETKGWLFICRNGLPAAFLNSRMRQAWATGLRHHDVFVQKYAEGLTHRAAELRAIKDRMTIVLPQGLRETFVNFSGQLVDPHSDAPGHFSTKRDRSAAWTSFARQWGDQARWFEAGPIARSLRPNIDAGDFCQAVSTWRTVPPEHLCVTHVPDVWISVNEGEGYPADEPDAAARRLLDRVVRIVQKEHEEQRRAESDPAILVPPRAPMSYVGKELQKDLDKGKVRIVRVSATELNPRYRGRLETSFTAALLLMAHCAAALIRSVDRPPAPQPNRRR
ncbi:MAG TPA: hypothetical protein VEQ41_07130 [Solirubrobacterales bacterium]|nr:hypothetical protein [Solirubrobacterales bacterium]